MSSLLTKWFQNYKLKVSLEEAQRKRFRTIDLRFHGLEGCSNLSTMASEEFLCNLKGLFLQGNYLNQLSRSDCHALVNLKALMLDYNQLTDLPFDFRRMKNLTVLNVSHNKFSDGHFFNVICQLKNLRVLWANSTGIVDIPKEIKELKQLHTLGLRRNNIQVLPSELFTLTQLKWLTLSGNKIQSIPYEIGELRNLSHLGLKRNMIVWLPTSFITMEGLQYLYLQYNFLTVDDGMISFIESIPNLRKCYIGRNFAPGNIRNNISIQEIVGRRPSTRRSLWGISSSASVNTIQPQRPPESRGTWEISPDTVRSMLHVPPRSNTEEMNSSSVSVQDVLNNNDPSLVFETESTEPGAVERTGSVEDLITLYRNQPNHPTEPSLPPVPVSNDGDGAASICEPEKNICRDGECQETEQAASNLSDNDHNQMRRTEAWVNMHNPPCSQDETGNDKPEPAIPMEMLDDCLMNDEIETALGNETISMLQSPDKILQNNDLEEDNLEFGSNNNEPLASKSSMFIMGGGKDPELTKIASIQETNADLRSRKFASHGASTTNSFIAGQNALQMDLDPSSSRMGDMNDIEELVDIITTMEVIEEHSNGESSRRAMETEDSSSGMTSSHSTSYTTSTGISFTDVTTNYDPSDWEYSTPSSLIDDQDIIQRLTEFQGSDNEDDECIQLHENDVKQLTRQIIAC